MSAETEDEETIPGEIFTYATLCPQDDMVAEDGLLLQSGNFRPRYDVSSRGDGAGR